jgi:hypothetical protein
VRKLVIAVVFTAIMAAGMPVFADIPEGKKSEYYYINLTLEKIWPYRAGYIVQYRKGFNRVGRLYLPSEWFTNAASKGEIILLPPGGNWPSLTVYYKNGEFSHVRLYVHRWNSHWTWGSVPQDVNIDDRFDNIETLNIEFE